MRGGRRVGWKCADWAEASSKEGMRGSMCVRKRRGENGGRGWQVSRVDSGCREGLLLFCGDLLCLLHACIQLCIGLISKQQELLRRQVGQCTVEELQLLACGGRRLRILHR